MKKMNVPSESTIINLVYHASVLSGLNIAYVMTAKSLLKIKPVELGKFDIYDLGKFVALTALSIATRDYLVKSKMIPADINV